MTQPDEQIVDGHAESESPALGEDGSKDATPESEVPMPQAKSPVSESPLPVSGRLRKYATIGVISLVVSVAVSIGLAVVQQRSTESMSKRDRSLAWRQTLMSGEISMTRLPLSDLDLQSLSLAGTDLSESDLSGSVLSDSRFEEVTLRWADLSEAELSEVTMVRSNAAYANFRGAKLDGAWMRDIVLAGSDLSEADLSGSDLTRGDLRGAILAGTDLSDARLVDADLRDVDLSQADLDGSELTGACFDSTTRWPDDYAAPATSGACSSARVGNFEVDYTISLTGDIAVAGPRQEQETIYAFPGDVVDLVVRAENIGTEPLTNVTVQTPPPTCCLELAAVKLVDASFPDGYEYEHDWQNDDGAVVIGTLYTRAFVIFSFKVNEPDGSCATLAVSSYLIPSGLGAIRDEVTIYVGDFTEVGSTADCVPTTEATNG